MDVILALKNLFPEEKESTLTVYSSLAAFKMLNRLYPFDPDKIVPDETGSYTVPDKYKGLQVEITSFMLNKRGAEGEISHSETGVSRSYENADIPESLMSTIIPMVGIL